MTHFSHAPEPGFPPRDVPGQLPPQMLEALHQALQHPRIRALVEEIARTPRGSLQVQWAYGPDRAYDASALLRRDVQAELGVLHQRLDAARRREDELTADIAALKEVVNALRADSVRFRDDLKDDRHLRHQAFAARWRALFRRDAFVSLVDALVDAHGDGVAEGEREQLDASYARALARALTAPDGPDATAVKRLLEPLGERHDTGPRAADLLAAATGLYREARGTGLNPVHDFAVPDGLVADPATAERYGPAARWGDPVDAVVLPAYRLGDDILSLPQVTTSPREVD